MMAQSSQADTTAKDKSTDSSQTPNSGQQSPDEFSFVVPGRPQPKGRPRMSRKGRVYTPKETVEAANIHTGRLPPLVQTAYFSIQHFTLWALTYMMMMMI